VSPSIDDVLAEARSRLPHRPGPDELERVIADGGLVVDIRPMHQREHDGELPGAVVVDRNVLEWRLDPTSPHRIPEVRDHDQEIETLQRIGLHRATDLDGGYQAWRNPDK
jgi:hypothetical protein